MIQSDYRDTKPVYEQIRDGIRKQIMTHAILEEEKLLPVRQLASKLAVNPNAVRRAYQELQQEGYVCGKDGELTVVSAGQLEELRRQELLREFDAVVTGVSRLSVDTQELIARVMRLAGGSDDFD